MIDIATKLAEHEVSDLSDPSLSRFCRICKQPDDNIFHICDACMNERLAHARKEKERDQKLARMMRWIELCPLNYRSTDWNRDGLSPECRRVATSWWAKDDGVGLGLYGPSGRGKTRAMWEILKRHFFAGMQVRAVDMLSIQTAVSDFHSNERAEREVARKLFHSCKTVRLLLIDDIGKGRSTAPVAAALHEIIECRTRMRLPTLWTTEQKSETLAHRFGEDYANGLVRRLVEFSTIVGV